MSFKGKYKYMHTLRGKPAFYWDNKQLVYACQYVEKLCDTLQQIKEEQEKSREWRRNRGLYDGFREYDYIKVVCK
jgi:hypothetical protein